MIWVGMRKCKTWKICLLFVLLIISSVFALYLGGIKSVSDFKTEISRKAGSIDVASLEAYGYMKKNNNYTSLNNNASFLTGKIHQYIKDLTITFEEPLPQDLEIQIYYANANNGFADNVPVSVKAVQGQQSVLLVLDGNAEYLRIDITTQPDQSFSLKSVTYNTNGYFGFSKGNFVSRTLILWGIFSFIAAHFLFDIKKMYAWIDRNRFFIGAGIVVFCVWFEIHGSSIAQWASVMPSNVDMLSDTLFGVPRVIRTDEWATFTPMTMTQSFGPKPYSWFSDVLRGTRTDMFMVYAQPVATPFIIFRPFLIGFLFLGVSRGLAFFWSARLVALFLVSYEFFKMLTKNKKYAVMAAALLTWSPLIQWWFAINGLVEMLIFAQLSLMMLKYYMTHKVFWKRCIALLVIDICAGGFILTLYPAWQVPIFYIIAAVALGIIFENYKCCKISGKDMISIAAAVAVLVACLGIILYISFDTIKLVMNTAYPGSRVSVGGDCTWLDMFKSWGNIFFPVYSEGMPGNACEASMIIDFFPLGIILSSYVLIIKRNKDYLLICLLAILCIMGWYSLFGMPEILAKLTGLSLSGGNRVMMITGVIHIIFLFRALSLCKFKLSIKRTTIVCTVFAAIVATALKLYYTDYLSAGLLVIAAIVAFISFFFLLKQKGKIAVAVVVILALAGGMFVNPVQKGVNIIYQFPLADILMDIEKRDNEKWAVIGSDYPITNYLLLYGLPTINSTNIYPSFETWGKLDKEQKYEDIYNRYAHIILKLSENSKIDKFELVRADLFRVNVTIEDLSTLDVQYVLSSENLNKYVNRGDLSLVAANSGYYIYEIID